ncbi:N-acetylmuramoyl-L-alanine amidase [Streptomyces sp. TRM43335]|uniref:N-acetylmuramoyl-L-alanine amidase n=1 Tax=Streptomyces taklimakanensis TaxID=2569853 RepID=A0A6G2BB80_9ACTN|nr:N-acetylmuramoyl-L-alanine amidase [Streptomyces taklimakanensis]MTE19152.1 N-acetylmuramoyl-L-alanine amidase [Streptomyces taklimakanensis]
MATPIGASTLVAALKKEGLRVVEVGDWRTHNRNHKGAWGPVHGVMIHHTVTSGSARTVEICRTGYSSLPGPLCHGVITKDGRVHLVGHGRANHAGLGDDDVLRAVIAERSSLPPDNETNTDGNRHFYGFECENLGDGRDPWPAAQLDAIERAAAALCRHHGWKAESVIGHLEWQPGKVDPRGFSMNGMRSRIRERLNHAPGWGRDEEDDVPNVIGEYQTTDIELPPRKWTTLSIKGVDILTGATRYQAMAHLTAAIPEGSTLQGRFYHLRPDGTRWVSGIIERIGTSGDTFADFHHSGSIARDEKLRFEAAYYPADSADDRPATITVSRLRGLYWN